MIHKVMTGTRSNPKVEYQVTGPQQFIAMVLPEEIENKNLSWNVDDANRLRDRYYISTATGRWETNIVVMTEDGQKTVACKVTVDFKTTDETTKPSSGSSGGSGGKMVLFQ